MKKIILIAALLFNVLLIKLSAQNLDNMLIEKMDNVSMIIPEKCTPDDLIIVINSSIQDLVFESNMMPDSAMIVSYYPEANQYIICHPRIKFKLTVSGTNLETEDIDIFDLENTHSYRISANAATGQVTILTNPRNSTAIFDDFKDHAYSTNQPIKMVSGKYRVKIFKPQYQNVDTVVVFPRDAEKTYNIDLVPQFAQIRLNLNTDDKMPFLKAPVISIDTIPIQLDSYETEGKNLRSFFDGVEFLKFYEGNIIPLNEGNYNITIEAESYKPYKTSVVTQNGKTVNINVSLEPIYGFLTFMDKQFAEGATVYLDNQNVGNIPLYKFKTRVGTHKVRYEKKGFATLEPEYTATVSENLNTDVEVSLAVAKKVVFKSDPPKAEVLMDGVRIGFTPFPLLLSSGNHQLLFRKNGYAGEKFTKLINDQSPAEDSITIALRPVSPLTITSEEDGLDIKLAGINGLENIDLDTAMKTPALVMLPLGEYEITLKKSDKTVYKSTITNLKENKISRLPVYSRTSFQLLSGNFENKDHFEGSFGRIHIIPGTGLSTSVLNLDYNKTTVTVESGSYSIDYQFETLATYLIFLNWDWRVGGSVFRQLDINLLGRARYTPGLKIITLDIPRLDDVTMQSYFFGFEISTRISYLNLSFRYGRQIKTGHVNYWEMTNDDYYPESFTIKEARNIGTIGITFSSKASKSNNMLRLWQRPLIQTAAKKTH